MGQQLTDEETKEFYREMGDFPQKEKSGETTKWQLTISDITEELRERLKGNIPKYIQDGSGNIMVQWYAPKGRKPMLNNDGVESIISTVEFHVNKNMILSTFSPQQISIIAQGLHENLAELLTLKWKDFDIKKANLSILMNCVMNFVWGGLNRALYGGEKRFMTMIERRVERIVDKGEDKKKKFGFLR